MDNRPSPHLRSEQIVPELPSILPTEDLPDSLSLTNHPTVLFANISRLAPPGKPPRFKRRPSTASSAEDKLDLLPQAPAMGDWSPSAFSSVSSPDSAVTSKAKPPDAQEHRSSSQDQTLEEMNRKAHAAVAGLRAEASRLAGLGA